MQNLECVLQERLDGLERDGDRRVGQEQRHLDQDTDERLYWHHGYASALKDILRILQSARERTN